MLAINGDHRVRFEPRLQQAGKACIPGDDKGPPVFFFSQRRQDAKLRVQRGAGGADRRFPDRREGTVLGFGLFQVPYNV